jgi:predicted deacetylase
MDIAKWEEVISFLNSIGIKAIIGVIPNNKDFEINFKSNVNIWEIVKEWESSGHIIALHGYEHLQLTQNAGCIPKNHRSEFAGLPLEQQIDKITKGIKILNTQGFTSKVFIPPFHSFDKVTLKALESLNIKIIYDGISFFPYYKNNILFFPQQNNYFKKRRIGIWTTCLHPSNMNNDEIIKMKNFIFSNREDFKNDFFTIAKHYQNRKESFLDRAYFMLYFIRRKLYKIKKGY